jgi:saccharopine dehydrogenase-like NADP-dependent oxidoreductase
MTMRLSGRHQADVTAAGAAEIARMLAAGEVEQPGLWLPEQVIPHGRFFERLASHGFRPEVMKSAARARTMAP